MKYFPLAAIIIISMALIACGDPKPGQYPPNLSDEREGLLTDSGLSTAKKEELQKETEEFAEKSFQAE